MLNELFPAIEPHNKGWISVSGGHEIYFEESGNPLGKPALFLHGGPGAGCSSKQRRFFDPEAYRIVLFDQRGCGRSRPHASLTANTTWDLVADIESLREHLGVEKWLLFGGSWGSALALAYAQSFPSSVSELVLRGIFMLRQEELAWFYQSGGASFIFPDAWEEFEAPIAQVGRATMIESYSKILNGTDRQAQLQAAQAWTVWEKRTSYLVEDESEVKRAREEEDYALAFARVECHYFMHGGFFEPRSQLLDDIAKIRHIPAIVVQGRYDVVCPMRTSWDLHKCWPEAEFVIVQLAGHSGFELKIASELVRATEKFKSQ